MKIIVKWSASSNISFKGELEIEVNDEDWELMSDYERDELVFSSAIEDSGFECAHIIKEGA